MIIWEVIIYISTLYYKMYIFGLHDIWQNAIFCEYFYAWSLIYLCFIYIKADIRTLLYNSNGDPGKFCGHTSQAERSESLCKRGIDNEQ